MLFYVKKSCLHTNIKIVQTAWMEMYMSACFGHFQPKKWTITLECLINVPVCVFISRKMPPYTGLIWHYTFIKKKNFFFFFFFTFKWISLHILATQFLRNTTNSPDLVVNKSGYLYNLSLGRLLEGDPLKCCLLIQAAGTGSDCASSNFPYNLWDLPPYTLIWHYTIIKFVRFATLYSYLALYVY